MRFLVVLVKSQSENMSHLQLHCTGKGHFAAFLSSKGLYMYCNIQPQPYKLILTLALLTQRPNFCIFLTCWCFFFYDDNYHSILNMQPESPGGLLHSLSMIYSKNIFVYKLSGYQTQEIKETLERHLDIN